MLQRIQTIYLLLAVAAMAAFLFAPVIRYEATDINYVNDVQAWDVKPFISGYFVFIVAIFEGIAIGFSLLAIALYKRRPLQIVLAWLAMLLHISSAAYIFYYFQTKENPIDIIYTLWNLAALPPVLFLLLAIFGIKKDEALVKSMDRLRD
jgi:hypothetical protein